MKWLKRKKENKWEDTWEDGQDTLFSATGRSDSPFDTGEYFKDYGTREKNWAEEMKGEFSKWIHTQEEGDGERGIDDFSDTMPQRPVNFTGEQEERNREAFSRSAENLANKSKKKGLGRFFQERKTWGKSYDEDMGEERSNSDSFFSEPVRKVYPKQNFTEQPWEGERAKSGKRDFPAIHAKNWQWILSFVITFSSMLVTPLIVKAFSIYNPYLSVSIMSGIAILGLLVLHPLVPFQLFRPLRKGDTLIVVVGTIVTILMVTVAANYFERMGFKTAENPIVNFLVKGNMVQLFVVSWIQFIAEEIYFALPFLLVFEKTKSLPRFFRIFFALLISSLIFGGLHLSTYSFNFLQSFFMIGFVRLLLSVTYLWTKNLTVSYLVHGLYDWILLVLAYYAMHMGTLSFLT